MDASVVQVAGTYPDIAPYNPSQQYPELPGTIKITDTVNPVYDAVRRSFFLLNLDRNNYDTPQWNPLSDVIQPGDTVFIKPNFVDDKHRFGKDIWSVITHPSILRAVGDYVALALKGNGKIIIGDNPHVDADFNEIARLCNLKMLQEHFVSTFGIECQFHDLRFWHTPDLTQYGFQSGRVKLAGDPSGTTEIDIKNNSLFINEPSSLFRGTLTNRTETIKLHSDGKNVYDFSNSIFNADVFISIPKLKTHCKVGATLNIKGLVGTVANKNALIHWKIGFPKFGGDEYPPPNNFVDYLRLYFQHFLLDSIPEKYYRQLRNFFTNIGITKYYNRIVDTEYQKQKMLRGAWDGNDTIWRMAVDIYNASIKDIMKIRKKAQRHFTVVDGIIGGERNGPHFPEPKHAGVLISGKNFLIVDTVAARTMGLNPLKIRYLHYLLGQEQISLDSIAVASEFAHRDSFFSDKNQFLQFTVPDRWESIKMNVNQ